MDETRTAHPAWRKRLVPILSGLGSALVLAVWVPIAWGEVAGMAAAGVVAILLLGIARVTKVYMWVNCTRQ